MKKQIVFYTIIALGVLSVIWCFLSPSYKTNWGSPIENQPIVHRTPVTQQQSTATTTKELSGKIDEHLTTNDELRDVNFCGKTYKVKQVLIDGVDVVQRVAEIAKQNLTVEHFPEYTGTASICSNIKNFYSDNAELQAIANKTSYNALNSYKKLGYSVGIDYPDRKGVVASFRISISDNLIYQYTGDAGDGIILVPIGPLK